VRLIRRLETDQQTVQRSLQFVQAELAAKYLDWRTAQATLVKALEGCQQGRCVLQWLPGSSSGHGGHLLWGVVVEPRCCMRWADIPDTTAELGGDRAVSRSRQRERRWSLRIRRSTQQARRRGRSASPGKQESGSIEWLMLAGRRRWRSVSG
jgi:hypothetical protein